MERIRFALVALILGLLLVCGQVWAQQKHYGRRCIGVSNSTCAAGYALVDVSGASDGDTAHIPADTYYGGPLFYIYDEDSGASESEPNVVDDDSVGGDQRWILQVKPLQGGGTNATSASAARTNLDVQQHDTTLDELAGITGEKGAMAYWDTASTLNRLRFNASDAEGYILQATGAYPNTVPALTNTLNITKFIFPNADAPTTDTNAQCSYDTDDEAIECYDGSNERIFVTRTKCEDITLATPDDLQSEADAWPLKHFVAEAFPGGVVITAIHISSSATCTDDLNFEEWSNNGTSWSTNATVEAISLTGTHTEDDGTLSDPNIAADAYLYVDLDGTSPCDISNFHFVICYEIKEND